MMGECIFRMAHGVWHVNHAFVMVMVDMQTDRANAGVPLQISELFNNNKRQVEIVFASALGGQVLEEDYANCSRSLAHAHSLSLLALSRSFSLSP